MKAKNKPKELTIEQKRQNFGDTIRGLREAEGMSLKQLEAKVHIAGSLINRVERSENKITLETAIKLARFFGVTLDTLSQPLE